MIKGLMTDGKKVFSLAKQNEMVVLVENGKETDNYYPVCLSNEPDGKSPEDWIRSISFHYEMRGFKGQLSFIVKPFKGFDF